MSVASIVSTVSGYIGQLLFDEVKFLCGVEDKVKSLKNEPELMSSRLIDLEPTCYLEDETFRIAVKQMREIAYEAEDVIDSLIVDESTSKLKRYTLHCSCFKQTHKLGQQIDKITAKITDLDKQMKSKRGGEDEIYLPWKDSYVRSFRLTGNYNAFIGNDGITKVSWRLGSRIWKRMLLRVLILENVRTSDGSLPSEIGNLVHLRYLEITDTNIGQIPESIGNLRNLLTFKYNNVFFNGGDRSVRLPNSLGKLGNLRHLHLPNVEMWEIYPDRRRGLGLGRLVNNLNSYELAQTNLIQDLLNPGDHSSNTLRKVAIGCLNKQDIEPLLFSPKSHSILSSNLVSFSLAGEYPKPPTNLRSLDPLINNCVNLRKLELTLFDITEMKTFPSSLTQLVLRRCLLVETMLKVIGQLPHLKSFFIWARKSSLNIKEWSCETGEFPQLLQLQLHGLDKIEGWRVEMGALPCVTTLKIKYCRNLKRIVFPDQQFLKRLQVSDIQGGTEIVVMETNKYES